MRDEFLAALRTGDPAECEPHIRKMTAAGRLNTHYVAGETYLHTMAREGHAAACDILLKAGMEVDGAWKGKTPLHLASQHGNLEACRVLIQHGANVNGFYFSSFNAVLPSELVTPLYNAASGGHQDVCRLLVDSGAIVAFMPENAPKTALTAFQAMVRYGHVEMARWLFLEAGEDLAQRTRAGHTLLKTASQMSSPERAAAMKAALRSMKVELAVASGIDVAASEVTTARTSHIKAAGPM